MSDSKLAIPFDVFRNQLLSVLDEAFDNVHGSFLDPGDSLFPTLEDVSAGQASQVVGACGNSIAGQVNHVIFYINLAMQYMRGENPGRQDWDATWKIVDVGEDAWAALKQELRESQQKLIELIHLDPDEVTEEIVGGSIAMVAHTAFHLGQIRHALCMVGTENAVESD